MLEKLPSSKVESFTGTNNPQPLVGLQMGEIILDLGCGAGLDMYLYAKEVGPTGKVIGVDISEGMMMKAKENMKKLGIKNTTKKIGHSTDKPLDE